MFEFLKYVQHFNYKIIFDQENSINYSEMHTPSFDGISLKLSFYSFLVFSIGDLFFCSFYDTAEQNKLR